jgi:hypothetical protein
VFNCDKLLTTLVKDAFTTVFVEVKDVFNCDKLLTTLVKEAFTIELLDVNDVFKINKDAFSSALRIAFPCVAVIEKEVFTISIKDFNLLLIFCMDVLTKVKSTVDVPVPIFVYRSVMLAVFSETLVFKTLI